MATYLVLGSFTDQGIRNVKETTNRAEAFRAMAGDMRVEVKDLFWMNGPYDICCVLEATDELAINALALKIGMMGNVKTQTMRAFNAQEMSSLLDKLGD